MKPLHWVRRGLTLAAAGAAGGAAVITVRHLLATPQPLENRLFGDIAIDHRPEGDIYYNVAGPQEAEPFVLLHDFYPGASNFEFRRLYPRLAADHRVYALDWLGFGLSERPALAYTGEFYAHLLNGFLRDRVGRPASVVAHGLAANVAVRAAADDPALYARLVLIEPRPLAGTLPGPTLPQTLVRFAQRASLGLVPYAVLATRPALRWQLARHAANRGEGAATDDALDHAYDSAHQFGGHHALLARLTGELDLPIENAFALLEPPVLVVAGAGDGQHSSAGLHDLALLNPHADTVAIAGAGDSVHEDQPAALMEHLTTWLRAPQRRATPTLSETRASARFPAGAVSLSEGLEHRTPALTETESASPHPLVAPGDAAAPRSTPTPSATPPRESAELQPPGASLARHEPRDDDAASDDVAVDDAAPDEAAVWSTEQFGEPRGLVSASPHLNALEGLAAQAPADATADAPGEAVPTAAFAEDDAATPAQVVGKPAAEVETADDLASSRASTAAETPAASTVPDAPSVTAPARQPSESTTPPVSPATERAAPASATSTAPTSGERAASPKSQPKRKTGHAGSAGNAPAAGRGASGKGGGRSTGGSSSGGGSGGRKSSAHRPKKA